MRGWSDHRCSAKSGTLEDEMVVLDDDCMILVASSVIPTASVHNRESDMARIQLPVNPLQNSDHRCCPLDTWILSPQQCLDVRNI